jgi:hypothetical protein
MVQGFRLVFLSNLARRAATTLPDLAPQFLILDLELENESR